MSGVPAKPKPQISIPIDEAGRAAELRDDEIVIRRPGQAPGLVEDSLTGLLVYDSGVPPGSVDTVDWIYGDRERRMRYVSGEVDEP